jgi:hypothetical protein
VTLFDWIVTDDLANALRRKGVTYWSIKAFDEAMQMNSLTMAVDHVMLENQ